MALASKERHLREGAGGYTDGMISAALGVRAGDSGYAGSADRNGTVGVLGGIISSMR